MNDKEEARAYHFLNKISKCLDNITKMNPEEIYEFMNQYDSEEALEIVLVKQFNEISGLAFETCNDLIAYSNIEKLPNDDHELLNINKKIEEIEQKFEDDYSNYIKENCNLSELKKAIEEGNNEILIKNVSDELFEKLSVDYLRKIIENYTKRWFNILSNKKMKYLINKIDLLFVLNSYRENKWLSDRYDFIFKYVDSIDDNVFESILENNLYEGIEVCSVVGDNNYYV